MKDNKNNKNIRFGSAIEHGEAHDLEHINQGRRSFLRNSGVAGGMSFFLGGLPLATYNGSLFNMISGSDEDRILVLIRLSGGNDGLNTIVPLTEYDIYRQKRPTLSWKQNELIELNDEVAIPKAMNAVMSSWDNGQMKIIQNVGYEDQNLSHFNSTDIWSSGRSVEDLDQSGWLGRMLECQFPNYFLETPEVPPSIQIGGVANLTTFNNDGVNMGMVMRNANELQRIFEQGKLYDLNNLPDCTYGDQLGFMRKIINLSAYHARYVSDIYRGSDNGRDDYTEEIGQQLAIVARLIRGGLGTKVYMVTMDGYDTHANQKDRHGALLQTLSSNIEIFMDDLRKASRSKDVLAMTFSEFGRRIEQNNSAGTDHGAASPLMMFGEGLNGSGVIGDVPDLNDVDDVGNLNYKIDFKKIYTSVLESWFCLDPGKVDSIMGETYDRMEEIGLECMTTSSSDPIILSPFHEAQYDSYGDVRISYELANSANIIIDVVALGGQKVLQVFRGRQSSGQHIQNLPLRENRVPHGPYVYRMMVDGHVASRKIMWLGR